MAYEKVKIKGINRIVKQSTGEVHHFLQVEVMQSFDIYMNDMAIKQMPTFEKMAGTEALLPVSWGEYKGRPALNFTDDCVPLPVSGHVASVSAVETEQSAAQPSSLFKSSKAG